MKKILITALSLLMVLGLSFTNLGYVNAIGSGNYEVAIGLKNASNIDNASMAAGALNEKGVIEINDEGIFLIAQFQTLDFNNSGTMFGNASNIKYYTDYSNNISEDATIVSYRNDATVNSNEGLLTNQEAVKEVKIPVTMNQSGVYINMYVDFMNYAPDGYIAIDWSNIFTNELDSLINSANELKASDYTASSYALLNKAIEEGKQVINGTSQQIQEAIEKIQTALQSLVKVYTLEDGNYNVEYNVLKANSDEQSMSAMAIKDVNLVVKDNKITVNMELGAVTVYGQSASIDKMEVEINDTYTATNVLEKNEDGTLKKISFELLENTELTNIKFYYGGSSNGSTARLQLALDKAEKIITETSRFNEEGTYSVNVNLWNASSNQASMANSALDSNATIIVKDNKATMYIKTKKMTLGTIEAYLQELKIKTADKNIDASVISKDALNNPTIFAFELPHEDEYIDVLVNPHVAIMGNSDIEARIKVDYSTLNKISNNTEYDLKQETTLESTNQTSNTTPSVKTGDNNKTALFGGLMVVMLGLLKIVWKKRDE